jgi:hypothetical protein
MGDTARRRLRQALQFFFSTLEHAHALHPSASASESSSASRTWGTRQTRKGVDGAKWWEGRVETVTGSFEGWELQLQKRKVNNATGRKEVEERREGRTRVRHSCRRHILPS